MREAEPKAEGSGLLVLWGPFVLLLALGGLFLAARAADDYTTVFGLLLAGFGVLLGFRLVARMVP